MKITITQIVIELPEQKQPAPVRDPNPLDTLLACLTRRADDKPQQREVDPYGPILKV